MTTVSAATNARNDIYASVHMYRFVRSVKRNAPVPLLRIFVCEPIGIRCASHSTVLIRITSY